MTLLDDRAVQWWSVAPVTAAHHARIADFLATTGGLGGRKFAADSRDVAEQLESAYPDAAVTVRDASGVVRGYAVLHQPHGIEPEILADFVFDPLTPHEVVDDLVGATVDRFRREADAVAGAYLRAFVGSCQSGVVDALRRRGARREGQFIRTRKSLDDIDLASLEAASVDGLRVFDWAEVLGRGLSEQVRRLQYDTFDEHFGNMSKTPEEWEHHLHSRAFTPDFSLAVVDDADHVVGYVLGSTYTAGVAEAQEISAHTDYIGVHRDHRRQGVAELLLTKVWLAALRRGLRLASLGTDVDNRSKAHVLYQRLGYVAVEHESAYRIDIGEVTT
ncbi:GNAT family N-acetyltransferase [Mycobacterium hodleri]|uniref:GNAT family N-acetyltransferase n=1 Tax=Mycolicibacterium hodleri TaxID=49897 RepID=A0A544VZP8_9MYCO|nr:GNAT family N-acetyltransferase [Mycolicibacterium hodleri]TQR85469.1 GNAT family N-acetyltransferase [Mycolicibacterium hodleri]